MIKCAGETEKERHGKEALMYCEIKWFIDENLVPNLDLCIPWI